MLYWALFAWKPCPPWCQLHGTGSDSNLYWKGICIPLGVQNWAKPFFLLRDNWWETKTASLGWKELSKTNFSPCLRIITWFDQFLQPRSPTSAAFCAEKPSQTTTSRASHNYWGHSGCQSSHQARFGSVTWMRSCIWHIPMLTALRWRKNPSCNWTNMLKPV